MMEGDDCAMSRENREELTFEDVMYWRWRPDTGKGERWFYSQLLTDGTKENGGGAAQSRRRTRALASL
jgi:hypothetical protein